MMKCTNWQLQSRHPLEPPQSKSLFVLTVALITDCSTRSSSIYVGVVNSRGTAVILVTLCPDQRRWPSWPVVRQNGKWHRWASWPVLPAFVSGLIGPRPWLMRSPITSLLPVEWPVCCNVVHSSWCVQRHAGTVSRDETIVSMVSVHTAVPWGSWSGQPVNGRFCWPSLLSALLL